MFDLDQWTVLRPLWLLCLPLAWFVSWVFYKAASQSSMWSRLFDQKLLQLLMPDKHKIVSGGGLSILIAFILSLIIIAMSGPSWQKQDVPLLRLNLAQVIAIDLSRSMLAQDISPTRFDRAIYKARDLVDQSDETQVALVAFAGAAFMVSPLTDDKATLLNFLDALNPGIMPVQGSRVDQAILMADSILDSSGYKRGQILVMSDGVSELSAALDAAEKAHNKGFQVSVLAIGTEQGGPLKDNTGALVRDDQNQVIIAKVGLSDLKEISLLGGGRFSELTADGKDINYLTSRLNAFDSSFTDTDQHNRQALDNGVWLVWLLLPFILLLFRKNVLWVICGLVLFPIPEPSYAFDWKTLWQRPDQQAYQHFQSGDYHKAYELSSDSLLQGSAQYKLNDYKSAKEFFLKHNSATADYNRGNALAHEQAFEQALEAYTQALEKDPDLLDARFNKKIIEDILKRQQPPSQQQQPGQDEAELKDNQSSEPDQSGQAGQPPPDPPKSKARQPEQPSFDSQDPALQEKPAMPEEPQESKPDKQNGDQHTESLSKQDTQNEDDNQTTERWLNRLPDDSSELLRRKFLRDYQRQRRK